MIPQSGKAIMKGMVLLAMIAGVTSALAPASASAVPSKHGVRPTVTAVSNGSATHGIPLHSATVPTRSLPAATQRAVKAAHPTATPNSITVYELVNYQDDKCLDAATQGIYGSGDKVQVWACFNDPSGHPNQWWWPAQSANGYTELVNYQSGLCLDADNSRGFLDGAKVQEWTCFNDPSGHPNQWWYFGPHGQTTTLPNLWGGGSKVLDAASPWINYDGDYVQLWSYLGGSNQFWWQ